MSRLILLLSLLLIIQCCANNEDDKIPSIDNNLTEYNTGLPRVEINTFPFLTIDKETWIENAVMRFCDKNGDFISEHIISIKGRGNSTWDQYKKPYTLKLNKKASFWGLPEHKRWVLLANAYDRTMMRYDIAFYIAKQTELEWTPSGDYVELNLNNQHLGTYYLCEQIKIDKNRINLSEEGILLEIDQYYDEINKFKSAKMNLPYMFKEPDENKLTLEKFKYVQDYINTIEDIFIDNKKLLSQEYLNYIDINSFIDYWFVQELMINSECNHPKSTYCYLDKNKKLTMGPVWDFDYQTLCNLCDEDFYGYDKTIDRFSQFTIIYSLYYAYLFKDPYFKKLVQNRWNMFRNKFYIVPIYIQEKSNQLIKSDLVNYPMWPHENTSGDADLPFYESINRIEWYYTKKLKFLDEKIKKGDFN